MTRRKVSCLLLALVALAGCASTGKILEKTPPGIAPAPETPTSAPEQDGPCPPGSGPWVRDLTRDWDERRYILPDGTSCKP